MQTENTQHPSSDIKFEELSAEEKIIAIAQDIIEQVKLKTYIAKKGDYVKFKGISKLKPEDSIQEALIENKLTCTVCALGSAFCSVVRFDNKLQKKDTRKLQFLLESCYTKEDTSGRKRLEEFISRKQLGLIETAFEERWDFAHDVGCSSIQSSKARFFGEKMGLGGNLNTSKRLVAIWENVIKNNGTFKP